MAVLQVPGLAREDSLVRPQKQLWAKYTKMMAEYLLAVQAPLNICTGTAAAPLISTLDGRAK